MKTNSTTENTAKAAVKTAVQGSVLNTKDKLLKQIIAYLRLHHHLDTAFLISKQTHSSETHCLFPLKKTALNRYYSYTLLMITDSLPRQTKAPNPAQIMDELYNHTGKKAKVYLITYTAAAVSEKIDYGNNFLVGILNAARCVYTVDDWWVRLKNYNILRHPEITKEIRRHWNTRFERANYLHSISGTIDVTENPLASIEVLQNVLKQVCLGLIYVFWEYKPAYTSLPYLLHLCGHFDGFSEKLFHGKTYQNHKLLHHLSQADQYMKFKIKTDLSLKEADKAWKKCDTFLIEAQKLAEQQIAIIDREGQEYYNKLKKERS